MSGQQVGTAVGFVAGFFLPGGPQVWATIGGIAGSYISPTKFKAPSIGDAQTQTSQTGMPIPKAFGRPPPFAPTLVDGDKIARKIKKESGGKGAPPVTESEGFIATRAFLCCEGPIAAFARIKRNEKIIYSTIEGDELDADSAAAMSQLRLYYGSRDQDPDPSLEALHGVGNTPCYPGRAYFVVVDDDETQTQGAANQYRVEVIAVGTRESTCVEPDLIAWWPLDDAVGGGSAREVIAGADGVYSDDVSAGPVLCAGSGPSAKFTDFGQYMVAAPYLVPSVSSMDEWTVSCWIQPLPYWDGTEYINGGGSIEKRIAQYANSDFSYGTADWGLSLSTPSSPPESRNTIPRGFTSNAPTTTSTNMFGDSQTTMGEKYFFAMSWKKDPSPATTGRYELTVNGALVDFDENKGNSGVTGQYIIVGGGYAFPENAQFIGCVADLKIYNRALTTIELAEKFKSSDEWLPLPDGGNVYYDRKGNLWTVCSTRSSETPAIWKDIATEICRRASTKLLDHIDFDNMTDEVPGFLLGNAGLKGSDYLRTLNTFYFTNTVEYDGKLRSIRLGGTIAGTLDPDDQLTIEEQDDDLREPPVVGWSRVTVVYPDPANKYVASTQTAPRTSPDVTANSEIKIECPIPFDGDRAAQITDIIQKIKFCELEGTFKRAFPAEYDKYVASDAVMWDGRRNLILKKSFDLGMVQFDGRYDRASAYTSVAIGTAAPTPSKQASNMKGPTLFAGFNSVRLRDSDGSTGIYVALRGLLEGWPGCLLQVSVDEQASWINAGTYTSQSILGKLASNVPASGIREPITITLSGDGQVESITDDQIDAGLNRFAMISGGMAEIGQFKTADENSDGTIDLTDTFAPQLGSAAAEHATGDAFVMISQSVFLIPIDIRYAGKTIYFRPVTLGTAAANNIVYGVKYIPQFTGPALYDAFEDETGDDYVDETGATYFTEET